VPKDAYSKSGVDYSVLDEVKRLAQAAAKSTAGDKEVAASRGESAYVWEEDDCYRAMVVEGLGTKNLVADEMYKISGKSYYDQIAQDTVAMIVNDLVVVGALPEVVSAYWGVGDSEWMADKKRAEDLINGWAAACKLAGAVWGGGETPALKGIIESGRIDLAGSAVGSAPKDKLVLGDKLADGDAIVLIESSGIHANGLTLARVVAEKLPDGYNTKLDDGRSYGEALLTPTHIYASLVKELQKQGIDIHYMVNITGHGWRKLMRAEKDFSYTINKVPPVPEEFSLIAKTTGMSNEEMYATFNMGAGFALMLPAAQSEQVIETAKQLGIRGWKAGMVKAGEKRVVIEPLDIKFTSEDLQVR
jgi:phosphoribosylformylglycinamidine cyclo-ligase